MSETLDPVAMELDQRQLAEQLLAQAKEQGVELVGPNGLLNQLTKNVLESAQLGNEIRGQCAQCPCRRCRGGARYPAPQRPDRRLSPGWHHQESDE
ncbi:hypothetical protein ATCCBAA256_06460 [Mycobacterium montefiorense]|nr:hypothetical protein ATCCBAA256_06460 [Mycobacterium montefiorense]